MNCKIYILSLSNPINDYYLLLCEQFLKDKDYKVLDLNQTEHVFNSISDELKTTDSNKQIVLCTPAVLFNESFFLKPSNDTAYFTNMKMNSISNSATTNYWNNISSLPCLISFKVKELKSENIYNLHHLLSIIISKRKIKFANPVQTLSEGWIYITPRILTNIGTLDKEKMSTSISQYLEYYNNRLKTIHNTKLFWDYRYAVNESLGSGVGSRGDSIRRKNNILTELGGESKSVLDIGFGDFEVFKEFNFYEYIGFDISKKAVEYARKKRSDLDFHLIANSDNLPQKLSKKIVLCYDVLIHQDSADSYHTLINYISEAFEEFLIVSGYVKQIGKANPMIFFYENLVDSLKRKESIHSIYFIGKEEDFKSRKFVHVIATKNENGNQLIENANFSTYKIA